MCFFSQPPAEMCLHRVSRKINTCYYEQVLPATITIQDSGTLFLLPKCRDEQAFESGSLMLWCAGCHVFLWAIPRSPGFYSGGHLRGRKLSSGSQCDGVRESFLFSGDSVVFRFPWQREEEIWVQTSEAVLCGSVVSFFSRF